jgi:hypothetical protein
VGGRLLLGGALIQIKELPSIVRKVFVCDLKSQLSTPLVTPGKLAGAWRAWFFLFAESAGFDIFCFFVR